ncbi:MAG: DUF3341 domain-containing protein [Myxococcaceae bacterium]|nr:DUF3341 domain-containing protein [Myxococcaceae bacterium]
MSRYWVLAEFAGPKALLTAARILRDEGLANVDLHSPHPIDGADEVLGLGASRVRWVGLVGGLVGAVTGYVTCWYTNAINFPIDVGGRPLNSAPAFIPVTFEAGVLFGAFALLFSMLAITGLPALYHPVFEAPGFERVSVDAYWLSFSIRSAEDRANEVAERVKAMGATRVSVVKDPRLEAMR